MSPTRDEPAERAPELREALPYRRIHQTGCRFRYPPLPRDMGFDFLLAQVLVIRIRSPYYLKAETEAVSRWSCDCPWRRIMTVDAPVTARTRFRGIEPFGA